MRSIGKKQKGYFNIYGVQFSLGYNIVQGGFLCWLVSLIPIGLVTLMIGNILQFLFLVLVPDPLLGVLRSNVPFLFLQQK
jgi:hypothetical protein